MSWLLTGPARWYVSHIWKLWKSQRLSEEGFRRKTRKFGPLAVKILAQKENIPLAYIPLIEALLEMDMPLEFMLGGSIPAVEKSLILWERKDEARDLLVSLVRELVFADSHPCVTLFLGAPLAIKAADGNLAALRENIACLKQKVSRLGSLSISPRQTLEKAVWLCRTFAVESKDFPSLLNATDMMTALEKKLSKDLDSESIVRNTRDMIKRAKSISVLEALVSFEEMALESGMYTRREKYKGYTWEKEEIIEGSKIEAEGVYANKGRYVIDSVKEMIISKTKEYVDIKITQRVADVVGMHSTCPGLNYANPDLHYFNNSYLVRHYNYKLTVKLREKFVFSEPLSLKLYPLFKSDSLWRDFVSSLTVDNIKEKSEQLRKNPPRVSSAVEPQTLIASKMRGACVTTRSAQGASLAYLMIDKGLPVNRGEVYNPKIFGSILRKKLY